MTVERQSGTLVINMPRKITGRIGMPKMELKCPSCGIIRLVQYREPSRRDTKCRHCSQFKGGRKPQETKGWTQESWLAYTKLNGVPNAKKFDGTATKENHPNWKGGITKPNKLARTSKEAIEWRNAVFARDRYTCVICNTVGGQLNAHHVKSFAKYPEDRLDIDNGQTLCKPCHQSVHATKLQSDIFLMANV